MQFINCTSKFTDDLIINTIKFWSVNSYEHIDVLLNGYEGTGAVLFPPFQSTLENLSTDFKNVYQKTSEVKNSKEIRSLLVSFLDLNNQFLDLLQRLKFEGFNAYPILYETVYHFIYEQEYIADLFKPLGFSNHQQNSSVPINVYFRRLGSYKTMLECIYNHIYFWSIIAAEHTSIIATVSPAEDALPDYTKQLLTNYANQFNNINFQLSNIYANLSTSTLCPIFKDFRKLNATFLQLLEDFNKPNSALFPDSIKAQLPALFSGVLDHLIHEHQYVTSLCDDFEKVLGDCK